MRAFRMVWTLSIMAGLAWSLAGCDRIGIGIGIPYTPISVGTSIPMPGSGKAVDPPAGQHAVKSGARRPNAVYRTIHVESLPTLARILVNGELVGSTPMDVALPFERGWFGHPKGIVNVVLEMEGYAPAGVIIYPYSGKLISLKPNGPPVDRVHIQLLK
jgi:hypothetical protein